jgi:hypothetical protein
VCPAHLVWGGLELVAGDLGNGFSNFDIESLLGVKTLTIAQRMDQRSVP